MSLLACAAMLSLVAACSDDPSAPPFPHEVVLSSVDTTARVGDTISLVARVLDQRDQLIRGAVSWSSSDTSVATVDSLGRVAALAHGIALVSARAGDASTNARVIVTLTRYRSIAAGVFSCAVSVTSRTLCWTSSRFVNAFGSAPARNPRISTLPYSIRSVVLGSSSEVCALDAAGAVTCETGSQFGQRGDGTTDFTTIAARVLAPPLVSVAIGDTHACGLTADGIAYCWGDNRAGALGRTTATRCDLDNVPADSVPCSSMPTPVNTHLRFASLSAGRNFTCGITRTDGFLYCWGVNDWFELGMSHSGDEVCNNGRYFCRTSPALVDGRPGYSELSSYYSTSCALNGGVAVCWGDGYSLGGAGRLQAPTNVPTTVRFRTIAVGGGNVCGIDFASALWCWGQAGGLLLGENHATSSQPVAIVGGSGMSAVSVGSSIACAIDLDGSAWCWGSRFLSPNGSASAIATPTRVGEPG